MADIKGISELRPDAAKRFAQMCIEALRRKRAREELQQKQAN